MNRFITERLLDELDATEQLPDRALALKDVSDLERLQDKYAELIERIRNFLTEGKTNAGTFADSWSTDHHWRFDRHRLGNSRR